jgi:hypothetical protein
MNYTRLGSKVLTVSWFDDGTGELGIVTETEAEAGRLKPRAIHASQLKADGGIREIRDAAREIRHPLSPGIDPREV